MQVIVEGQSETIKHTEINDSMFVVADTSHRFLFSTWDEEKELWVWRAIGSSATYGTANETQSDLARIAVGKSWGWGVHAFKTQLEMFQWLSSAADRYTHTVGLEGVANSDDLRKPLIGRGE